jgi:ParB-like chromosome segregation protein Spo0J
MSAITDRAIELAAMIAALPIPEQVTALNEVRALLHDVSPFRDEPVDLVLWRPAAEVVGNDYNPNVVAPPEMRLLRLSIQADGYTQPIVAYPEAPDLDRIVDGFHRSKVGQTCKSIRERVHGYLPVTHIRASRTGSPDRIAATIRHNRARGKHGVEPMRDIVIELLRSGLPDDAIGRELGMDADEVLRYRQIGGLPALYRDREFSRSWNPPTKDDSADDDT